MKRPGGETFQEESLRKYGKLGSISLELALRDNEDLKDTSRWLTRIGIGTIAAGEAVLKTGRNRLGRGLQAVGFIAGLAGVAAERFFDRKADLVATEMERRVTFAQFAEYVRDGPIPQLRNAADVRRLMR